MLTFHKFDKPRLLFITTALLAALPVPAGAAPSANGTLTITVTPGTPFAVTVTTASTGVSQDNGDHTCLAISVRTPIHGWSLAADYITSPATVLNVAIAQSTSGNTCSTSAIAGSTIRLGGNTTALLSNQNGSQIMIYHLTAQPIAALSSPTVLTLTFVVGAPRAPAARGALKLLLDKSGRLLSIVSARSDTRTE